MNLRYLFLIVFSSLAFLVKWKLDDFFMNTLYSILGIMFSIGLGLVVTFNMHGVSKRSVVLKIRNNLKFVRNSYIKYFTISTILYILDKYFRDNMADSEIFHYFNISIFAMIFILFSIAYCIVNFLKVQQLSEEIFDEVN